MDKCFVDLAKFVLFLVTFGLWVLLAVVLFGLYHTLSASESVLGIAIEPVLDSSNPSALHFSLWLIAFVLSLFFFVVAFLGCCGAALTNRCLLGSFVIVLFVLLGAALASLVLTLTHFESPELLVAEELRATIPYFDAEHPEAPVSIMWRQMQTALNCCGAQAHTEWSGARGLKPGRQVPASCCIRGSESECVYQPLPSNAHLRGCMQILGEPVNVAFFGVPIALFTLLILALCVCSGNNNGQREALQQHYRARKRSDPQRPNAYLSEASAPPYYESYPRLQQQRGHEGQPLIQQRPPPYNRVAY